MSEKRLKPEVLELIRKDYVLVAHLRVEIGKYMHDSQKPLTERGIDLWFDRNDTRFLNPNTAEIISRHLEIPVEHLSA